MVEQIRVQEMTDWEHGQDCGCGCGCDSGTAQQELLLVSSARVAEMRRQQAGTHVIVAAPATPNNR